MLTTQINIWVQNADETLEHVWVLYLHTMLTPRPCFLIPQNCKRTNACGSDLALASFWLLALRNRDKWRGGSRDPKASTQHQLEDWSMVGWLIDSSIDWRTWVGGMISTLAVILTKPKSYSLVWFQGSVSTKREATPRITDSTILGVKSFSSLKSLFFPLITYQVICLFINSLISSPRSVPC